MHTTSLPDIIRQYIPLPAIPNSKGWYQLLCKVCGDRGHKGNRAAFQFDGDSARYHCFNCGIHTGYNTQEHDRISKKFKGVLRAFGVPSEEWQQLELDQLRHRDDKGSTIHTNQLGEDVEVKINPTVLPPPPGFILLSDSDTVWGTVAKEYLALTRGIDYTRYPFMVSTQSHSKWFKRLIIPIYKNKNLIFYQGRDLTGTALKKYESPMSVDKDRVMFGFDRLFEDHDKPLFITEGFFDAYDIKGVGLMGNTITTPQEIWLNKSPRQKVYIPDRFGDGDKAAKRALELGWSISIPDTPESKDINEAVLSYGLLYTLRSLHQNITSGLDAEVQLSVYIK